MIHLFKDYFRTGQLLAILFLIGITLSLYEIYSIPSSLSLTAGYSPAFVPAYVAVVLTFLFGMGTIFFALYAKKELIVFRDKQLEDRLADHDAAAAGQSTISLDGVKERLRSAAHLKDIFQNGIQAICKQLDAGQGAAYAAFETDGVRKVELRGGYALSIAESTVIAYEFGEGLVGQAAASSKTIYVDDVPDGYIKIISGLGSASPKYLLFTPVKKQDQLRGVLEIASFTPITEDQRKFVEEAAQLIADKLSNQ
jgi:methyl-accepting chemotaxis protein